jgi:hypothetical protein
MRKTARQQPLEPLEAPSVPVPTTEIPEPVSERALFTIHVTKPFARKGIAAAFAILLFLGMARVLHWWNWGLSQQEIQAQKVAALQQQVGKLMILPQGQPLVATVTDPASLKSQPFYADVQSGDMLLVYQQARRAILFRPSAGKIVNVGPVYFSDAQSATSTGR